MILAFVGSSPTGHPKVHCAVVAQLVEQRIRNAKVGSSILPCGTSTKKQALLAQLAEHPPCKREVGSSRLSEGTIQLKESL